MVLFPFRFGCGEPNLVPQSGRVAGGSPAATAGIRPGDTIVSANNQPVKFFSDLQSILNTALQAEKNQHATVPVTLQIRRLGSAVLISTTVNVREHPPAGHEPMSAEASETVDFVSISL